MEARRTFFDLLAEHWDTAAVLISSHRLDEIAALVNRVADLVDLTSRLGCRLVLTRVDDAFERAVRPWGFCTSDGGRTWEGEVPGPDRLRFLGLLSRYAALLASIGMDELRPPVPEEVRYDP